MGSTGKPNLQNVLQFYQFQNEGYQNNLRDGRRCDMLSIATHLVAFWDGKSSGTKHMIEIAQAKGIPVWVFTTIMNRKVLTCYHLYSLLCI